MPDAPTRLADIFRESAVGRSENFTDETRKQLQLKLEKAPKINLRKLGSWLGNPKEWLDRAKADMLDIDISDILCNAWSKLAELQEFRDPSRETSGYPLSHHAVHSQHKPTLRVLYGGQEVTRLTFCIDVEFDVAAATLRIQKGHILEIKSGKFSVKGKITLEELPGVLHEEKTAGPFDIPGRVLLGEGIEIPAL